jgi:preprotein translocase subunit SecD
MSWLLSFIANVCVLVTVSTGSGTGQLLAGGQGAVRWDWLNLICPPEPDRAREATAEAALKRLGGTRLVLKLEPDVVRREVVSQLQQDVVRLLREGHIPFQDLAVQDDGVEVRIVRAGDREPGAGRLAGSVGGNVDIRGLGEGLVRLMPTQAAFAEGLRASREQAVDTLAKRLEALGVVAPGVRPDGADRIVALLPGVTDPERVHWLLYKTASLTFRLIDTSMTGEDALRRGVPPGSEVLYDRKDKTPYLVSRQDAMRGGTIIHAAPGFDERTREPIVSFRFDAAGARRFAQVTQENIGRPFAVVLDNEVVAAPIIREPILKGSGQVSGSFTLEEANTLSILLSRGVPPALLTIVDRQVVEPETKVGQR